MSDQFIPMSIATAVEHVAGCLVRRGAIAGSTVRDTEEGVVVTVRRLINHAYMERSFTVPDATSECPVTESVFAQYSIISGLGRVGERQGQNCRMLLRQTALYRGLDGEYHITGVPDRVAPPAQEPADRQIRLVA